MFKIKKSKMYLSLVATVTAFIVIFSISGCYEEKVDNSAEVETIMNLQKEWSSKSVDGSLDWIIDLHAENAVQLPPGADIVQGKEALRVAWDGLVNTEGLEVSWEPTKAFVSQSGDMAYDYGKATITNPDSSVVNTKYLVVWMKVDGEWKVSADMFNMNGAGGE